MRERQVSFSAGELSPELHGRTDLREYHAGARTLLNLLVTPGGVLVNRPGTVHITDKIEDFIEIEKMHPAKVVGGFVLYVFVSYSSPTVYEMELKYLSDRRSFDYDTGVVAFLSDRPSSLFLNGDVLVAAYSLDAPAAYMAVDPPGEYLAVKHDLDLVAPAFPAQVTGTYPLRYPRMHFWTLAEFQAITPTPSFPAREWSWIVTFVVRRSDGSQYETQGYEVTELHYVDVDYPSTADPSHTVESPHGGPAQIGLTSAVYPTMPRVFWSPLEAGDAVVNGDDGDVLVCNRLYRGRAGRWGYIAESTSKFIDDDGASPQWSNPPPSGVSPFAAGEYPTVGAFFEDRMLLGGSTSRPRTLFGSAIGKHTNFDQIVGADDDDAYELTLKSKVDEQIVALVPREKLLVFTTRSEWVITGEGEGMPITPNSMVAHRVSQNGSSSTVEPVEAGDTVFYVGQSGSVIYAMALGDNGFRSVDVTLASRHLFDGYSVADMAWQTIPYPILWVVRSDGALLALSYAPLRGVVAWTRHEISGDGLVKKIAVLPGEGGVEDTVYLVVDRDGARSIEALAEMVRTDIRTACYLDRAVTYDGTQTAAVTIGSYGGTIAEGEQESVQINGTDLTLVVGDILRIDGFGGKPIMLLVQSEDDPGVAYLCCPIYGPAYDVPAAATAVPAWFVCRSGVSGLDHLEGQTVTALADGAVYKGLTVNAGSIDLGEGNEAGIITVGLPYDGDLESLDSAQERGRQKIVKKILVELKTSRGGSVGHSLDGDLVDIKDRTVAHGYDIVTADTKEAEVIVKSSYDKTGRVAFRQSEPLPTTIVGITREYELGG